MPTGRLAGLGATLAFHHGLLAARRTVPGVLAVAILCTASTPLATLDAVADQPALVTLSIVGTSDLHGAVLPRDGFGGLPLLAGYINNLRAARASDGGAVLLLDSGDTFQGTVESNLSEGALVVDAYNAMGYTAQAVGNHDFDFGPADSPMARQLPGDPRGALQARAAQARYPFLAANLIDDATGRPVEWTNVRPSVIVEAAGVKIGIVGVMTINALRSTLAANVQGLRIAPLEPAIEAEASKLRAAGAAVVIVASHAGGRCDRFDQPTDVSSCEQESEIFQVARSLPRGLVDVIAAGHTHAGLAHRMNGMAIIEALSHGRAFGRVDLIFDRNTRQVARMQLFAPRTLCAHDDPLTGNCESATASAAAATYEGKVVAPDPTILNAMRPALERVRKLQATALGVSLDVPIVRSGELGSPLGNLFAEALHEAMPGTDAAIINNASRGLRADLPGGPITLGRLYDVFPFDNRVVQITVTGAELRRWLAGEIREGRQGALGMSGLTVRPSCVNGSLRVELVRATRQPVQDEDRLLVATIGGPTLSGSVAAAASASAVVIENPPIVREAVEDWLRRRGNATLRQLDNATPRRPGRAATTRCHALPDRFD